ncbi:MAG: CDP-glycerol glycerophosphotransferase family protein [Epsilonproteobacteria bacterium]|nr:CDP-glycerol glycerophosphotransferase family protein [Campylobacterota bacterium]
MNTDVVFYVAYPYYFPHFLPISKELEKQNFRVKYVLSDTQNSEVMEKIAKDEGLDFVFGEENLYTIDTKVIVFANVFEKSEELKAKTIFLCHGTGTKQCGFETALQINDIVIVEGEYRYNQFSKLYPKFAHKLKKVGYSKLDSVVNISGNDKETLFRKYNLDSTKKTILYAPTFFPSSIEKMSDSFPADFSECNIIVKPHYISLERSRYKNQQKKFAKWAKYPNCQIMPVNEYNLVPFLSIADVMISDESAAIFEFASLNKPVIINRFLKLRWTYYLNPKKLLKRRDKDVDGYRSIGENPKSYKEMVVAVKEELQNPSKYEEERLQKAVDICGIIDGKVSSRIVEVVKELIND